MIVEFDKMQDTLCEILVNRGANKDQANIAAKILTDNTCDGVSSHGINRFNRILEYIDKGYIDLKAQPEIVNSIGSIEVIDGHYGLGMNNAKFAMDRSIELAKTHGIGCVSIKYNNHWMRGATYGLQAADAGMIGLCFTNTMPNMPAWGASDSRIGNNPLVIAVPKKDGAVILDMAMSQFSYGKVENTALNEESLPLVGGYNKDGELTKNPSEILETGRILPTGFWKGSGLSMVLDLMATILSGGLSTREIGDKPAEFGVSQVFICIDPTKTNSKKMIEDQVDSMINYIKGSEPVDSTQIIRYPGEGSNNRRNKQLKDGIYVHDKIWDKIIQEFHC